MGHTASSESIAALWTYVAMSLISGSYSRLLLTGGALLLRDDMVEKAAAVEVRDVMEFV
jgi:hypothetical protein